MKALVQLFGAMMAAIVPLTMTGAPLSVTDWINVGVVAAGAGTVYIAENQDGGVWKYAKLFMSLISVVGVVLISALADGLISVTEWYQMGVAVLTAFGVLETPVGSVGGRHAAPGAA